MSAVTARRLVMAGLAGLSTWIIGGSMILLAAWTVIPPHGYLSSAVEVGVNWWAMNVGARVWRWSAPCD